ncbi:MAG: hypothetical protein ABSC94_05355 [Polyangiaceae bacterium]
MPWQRAADGAQGAELLLREPLLPELPLPVPLVPVSLPLAARLLDAEVLAIELLAPPPSPVTGTSVTPIVRVHAAATIAKSEVGGGNRRPDARRCELPNARLFILKSCPSPGKQATAENGKPGACLGGRAGGRAARESDAVEGGPKK